MQPLDMEFVHTCFDHEGEPEHAEHSSVPATWECQRHIYGCDVFALRKALERAVLPLTILTDNVGVVQGLDKKRGSLHVNQNTQMRTNGKQISRTQET